MSESKRVVSANEFVASIIVFFICTIAAIYIAMDSSQPKDYRLLWLLPATYGILNVIFCHIYRYKTNAGIVSIQLLEFFRLVLIPIFLVMGDYYTAMSHTRTGNVETAIFLMIYEVVAVYIVLSINIKEDISQRTTNKPKVSTNALKYIIAFMILFLVIVKVLFPGSVTSFKTIFDMRSDDFTTWTGLQSYSRYELGTLARAVGTLFTMVFTWTRYLLPIGIMVWAKKRIRRPFAAILLSLVPILLQMLFITNTIMDGILCAFVLLLVLVKMYPSKRKTLISLAGISFVGVIGFYFFSRYIVRFGIGSNAWGYISENATAYVGGVDNVAAMMNVGSENKWSSFFYNVYGAIPFNSSLFGLRGDKLSVFFNAANGRRDGQIPPTIGVGWYYYTAVLAPIESVIFTHFAVKYGSKASVEKNIWKYAAYTLTAIMMAMGFTTYNAAIVLNYVTTLLIPLLVLCRYTNDLEFKMFEE